MSLKELLALLIRADADDETLEEGVALWERLKQRPALSTPPSEPVSKPNGKTANGKSNARSTRQASVLALKDWLTVDEAARQLGLTPGQINTVIADHGLAVRRFTKVPPLVHVRQIAYWLAHHAVLDVDEDVFEEWVRLMEAARQTGLDKQVISRWVVTDEVAFYRPHPKLTLVNLAEVQRKAKKR